MAVSLFVSVWVTRYLGPDRFGQLSYAQSLVALISAFASLGLNAIVVKDLVAGEDPEEQILGSAFVLKVAAAFASLGLLIAILSVFSQGANTDLLVLVLAISYLFQSLNVIDFYFQSKVKSRYVVYANTAAFLLTSLLKIGLIVTNAGLICFAWVFVIESFFVAAGLMLIYRSRCEKSLFFWRFSPSIAKSLFHRSLPLALSGLVISVYVKIDKIMLMEISGSDSVGIYSAAAVLSETWFFVPTIITASLFPSIVEAKKQSETLYTSRMRSLFGFLFWLAVTIALPVSIFSPLIVDLLYGQAYLEAASVLQLHIWTAVFVCLGMPVSKWFVVEGLERYALYRALAGAMCNVALNYILIPIHGPYGAAVATLITSFATAVIFNLATPTMRSVLRLQLASIIIPVHQLSKPT